MERKMGDSLLKWLGHDKPPSMRVSHKVWRKQLVDRTRQLKLGADRARQRSDMLMLDGTDIVRVVEAAGARHESAGAGPEDEPDTGAGRERVMMRSGRAAIWGTGLQALVWTQREQKLGLGLVMNQRLVPEQRWLHQRRMLPLVLGGRRHRLMGRKHQTRYWSS